MTQAPLRADDELGAYKQALEHYAIVAATNRSGRITYVNEKFCEISRYPREELIGQKHSIVNSGHHPRSFFVAMWKTIARGDPWRGEICNRAKDGTLYWVDTTIVPLRDSRGRVDGYLSVRYDISSRKAADAALQQEVERRREAETLLTEVIEAVPDGIAAYDRDDRLSVFNSAYRDFYDRAGSAIHSGAGFETILRQCVDAGQFSFAGDAADEREDWIGRRLREHREPGRAALQQLWDGRWLQVQERRSPRGFVVGVRTDITALKRAERQIKEQAERDPLTGLYNRRVLLERLGRLQRRLRKSDSVGALIVIDLDNFKDINDTLGHAQGDELLRTVAGRIQACVRASDTVARLGGDEFAVILHDIRSDDAIERLLRRLCDVLHAPAQLGDRMVRPGASLGVSVFPRDGRDADELLQFADIALYHAKARGRGRYCFFDSQLREQLERREAVADGLRSAIEHREIGVALQPQFSLLDMGHEGFEVLARWTGGALRSWPAEFIAVAEQTRLIVPLGLQVMEAAFAEASRLVRQGRRPGRIAVNVAAAQLKSEGFALQVAALLTRFGLTPAMLELEVTENVLLDRSAILIAQALNTLHGMGIHIALDDFGTGHASLAHLKSFPVDRLKIDRSFVAGVGADTGDEAIVRTIVTLAHSLGKRVVAEGIETEAQLRFLQELGCDTGQGFIVSRALSPAEAEDFLRTAHGDGDVRLTA